MEQPDRSVEVVKAVAENSKKLDEARAESDKKSGENRDKTREAILNTIEATTKTVEAQLSNVPTSKSVDRFIDRPTNANRLSQIPTRNNQPSNLGRILKGRDLADERAANNITPPSSEPSGGAGESGGESHSGHSHGFKATPKAYNQPISNNF